MFGLGRLFYIILLLINAVAILNEERFLKRLGVNDYDENSVFNRFIQLIKAVQTVLRIPLIAVNLLVVVYELALG